MDSDTVSCTNLIRPVHPLEEISHLTNARGEKLLLLHPGYDDGLNLLLVLPAFDNNGCHYATVQTACGILAGNRWDVFLSTDRQGTNPIRVNSDDDILPCASYYLQVPQAGSDIYPITPNFEHWQFPHHNLPPKWRDLPNFPQGSTPSDSSYCRLTQRAYGVENAHLVPSAEKSWFGANNMALYTSTRALDRTQDPANMIPLRSDIHSAFDAKLFTIVPCGDRLLAYCFNDTRTSHFERDFHRVELHRLPLDIQMTQFLFARFAYTIFDCLHIFLDRRTPRFLRLREGTTWKVDEVPSSKCKSLARVTAIQGKLRSRSAQKRMRPTNEGEHDWDENEEWSEEGRYRSEEEIEEWDEEGRYRSEEEIEEWGEEGRYRSEED